MLCLTSLGDNFIGMQNNISHYFFFTLFFFHILSSRFFLEILHLILLKSNFKIINGPQL